MEIRLKELEMVLAEGDKILFDSGNVGASSSESGSSNAFENVKELNEPFQQLSKQMCHDLPE